MCVNIIKSIDFLFISENTVLEPTFTCQTFQVMIQSHNRRMSFSLYISALAVTDTVVLLCGKSQSSFCIVWVVISNDA